jgi:hypothetical protein
MFAYMHNDSPNLQHIRITCEIFWVDSYKHDNGVLNSNVIAEKLRLKMYY